MKEKEKWALERFPVCKENLKKELHMCSLRGAWLAGFDYAKEKMGWLNVSHPHIGMADLGESEVNDET